MSMKEIDNKSANKSVQYYTNKNKVAKEFSRRREHELFDYERARQSKRQSVGRIQSALCEVSYEQNSCGLKISIVNRIASSCVKSI